MNKTTFENTKWDVREWTDEMKQNWNNKVIALGFEVLWSKRFLENSTYLWLNYDKTVIYIDDGDNDFFLANDAKEMKYEDMFPENKEDPFTTMDEEHTSPPFIEAEDIFSQMKTIAKENSMFISFDGLNDEEDDVIVVTHISSDTEYVVNSLEEFSLLTQSFKALEKFERKI